MVEPLPEPAVQRHYSAADLEALILGAVAPAARSLARVQVDDLATLDQLHAGGKPATMALARLAGLRAGMSVLDVGGGLGGPARTLAAEFGCRVCVLDLTAAFCRVGARLTERTGLGDRVRFVHGSALAVPLRDAAFDVVWTQHSTMNIADKAGLYREARRVLRPGGLLVFHEVMAGPGGPPYYPAPWADDPSISFLSPPDEVRAVLRRLGFLERAWVDVTATAVEEMRRARPPSGPPHLLVLTRGPEAGTAILRNFRRSVEEGRVAVIQAVFERT
jgi:ubiquinone/menaquinone biosynthesis C-methylase UbiE